MHRKRLVLVPRDGFTHKLWKTMCASQSLAVQVLDFIEHSGASPNFRQTGQDWRLALLGPDAGTVGCAYGIVLPSMKRPSQPRSCAFLHRFCGKDCEQGRGTVAKPLIDKGKTAMRLFWAAPELRGPAVHTNCGKRCAQRPPIRPKLLIPLGKSMHDSFFGSGSLFTSSTDSVDKIVAKYPPCIGSL